MRLQAGDTAAWQIGIPAGVQNNTLQYDFGSVVDPFSDEQKSDHSPGLHIRVACLHPCRCPRSLAAGCLTGRDTSARSLCIHLDDHRQAAKFVAIGRPLRRGVILWIARGLLHDGHSQPAEPVLSPVVHPLVER